MVTGAGADLGANLHRLEERIVAAAQRAGRQASEVTLVGVSKTFPADLVANAVEAGLRHVGENRVQEAESKFPAVAGLLRERGVPPPTWHMVGHLQTNKVKKALDLFDVVESVDSARLAQALSDRVRAANPARPPLGVLLEVYFGDDPDRPGFRPADLPRLAKEVLQLPGLDVHGLMTVAPLGWDAVGVRSAFRALRELRDRLSLQADHPLPHLSMGMSDDFEIAVEEGSTMIRVGRAIFGARREAPAASESKGG